MHVLDFVSKTPADLEIDHNFWKIIEENFPPEVRDTQEMTLRCMNHPDIGNIVAVSGTRTVALITFAQLFDPNLLFVGYLAVEAEFRGHGIGKKLLDLALDAARARLKDRGLALIGAVFEAEKGGPGTTDHEQELLSYYRGIGARILTPDFLMPEHMTGEERIVNLLFYANRSCEDPRDLDVAEVTRQIYEQHYCGHKGLLTG